MANKKYSSYAEIDRDLAILKLEKEIDYHKLVLNIHKTKNSFTPENILSGFFHRSKEAIPDSLWSIMQTVIPYIVSYFANKKRGD